MIKIRCDCRRTTHCKYCHGTGWRYDEDATIFGAMSTTFLIIGIIFAAYYSL